MKPTQLIFRRVWAFGAMVILAGLLSGWAQSFADTYCKYGTDPHTLALQALRNWWLCQCSNGLFPVPLACLCRSNKCVFVVCIQDARVLSDIRYSQKRLATFVDGDCLEMTESIAPEIDRGAFYRQCLCAFVGEDDGDCVE